MKKFFFIILVFLSSIVFASSVADTEINSSVLEKSSNDIVLVGKDGWLFYVRVDDGDPISCYQGTNLFNDDELQALADNCIKQRDFLLKQGREFVIFFAPNKERVYSEYMPNYLGEPAENYRALQVYQYLKENTDIRIVYPYDELMQAKMDVEVNLYNKTDSHWNYVGAYVGARALNKELGIDMPSLTSEEITISKGNITSGDLAQILNLEKQLEYSDYQYSVSGYNTHNMETIEWDSFEAFIFHSSNADPRRLYVIRDSFASALAPYVGSQFNDSYFRHRGTYSYDNLVNQNPDIVVYEVAERYVDELMDFSIP